MIQKGRNVFLIFLTLIALSLLFTVSVSANTGQPLSFGKKVSGEITDNDNTHTYTVTLEEPGKLMLEVDSYIDNDVDVTLKDEKGTNVLGLYYFFTATPTNPVNRMKAEYLEAGTYSVIVQQSSFYTGKYDLMVDFTPTKNNEIEPNNGTTQAQTLPFNKKVKGLISWNDDKDTYKLTLDEPGEINLLFNSFINGSVFVKLTDVKGNEVFSRMVPGGTQIDPDHWERAVSLEAGTYYIHVDKNAERGVYDIEVDFNAANNNEIEPNNGKAQAQAIGLNNQIKGLISWNDSVDTYKVSLTKTEDIILNITSYIRSNVDVIVEDEKGNRLLYSDAYLSDNESQNTVTWKKQLKAGTYYIYVKKYFGYTGTYDVSIATVDFADVAPGKYYYGSVIKLTADNIISGYPDGNFRPHNNIPRWQSILLLQRALNLDIPKDYKEIANKFKDVGEKHPYAGEIAAVYKAGIFQGNGNVMGVNDLLTREQMASVLVRGFDLKGDKTKDSLANVTDAKQMASYHKNDVKTLYDLGVTTGTGDGKYSPKGNMTRAQFVTFIDRIRK